MHPVDFIDPRDELEELYQAEYGNPVDILLRGLGVPLGALLLQLYTGWLAPVLWVLIFAGFHAVQWPFLTLRRKAASQLDAVVGGLLFIAVQISFLWLPTVLAANDDSSLMLIGMMVFVITAMYHVRRADRSRWLVLTQVAIFATSLAYISYACIERSDDPIVHAGVVMVTLFAIIFISVTMLGAHHRRLEIIQASANLAHEQKMSAIGKLAGGVAHDFNNSLTVIKGNLELFDEIHEASERREVMSEALRAAERAEGVIEQLLIYARKAPSKSSKIDANKALEDLEAFGQTMVPERIQLDVTKLPHPVMIEVDHRQLSAALLNLVKNSVDAIEANGTIVASLAVSNTTASRKKESESVPGDGRFVTFSVFDTGSGIPPEILGNVSDPFFTTKEPGKGTGLGLSMASGFATESGGKMEIESTKSGTLVSLILPLYL
ncbi:sensor histidine kinase [Gymnodinialimonas hymeniacidonis]|uniref:sensor histidine kinase n=1 Tax=Gymnodinialimonas hymeniacidonis TaxID=3126508 RepID=UPI0034C64657